MREYEEEEDEDEDEEDEEEEWGTGSAKFRENWDGDSVNVVLAYMESPNPRILVSSAPISHTGP
jgi:hypothetical protein